jgi:hypothetical protein
MRLHVSIDDKALIERCRPHFSAQGSCWAQLGMLKSLLAAGLLKEVL